MIRVARGWPRAAVPILAAALVSTGAMAAPASAQAPDRTIQVDSTTDAPDATPGDGTCATAAGACTLRAAVMEADADDTHTGITIEVPAATYTLTLEGTSGTGADGELRLDDEAKPSDTSYAIVGVGGTAVIDASGLGGDDPDERVLRIVDTDDADGILLDVTLRHLELTGGAAPGTSGNGGAVLIEGDPLSDPPTRVLADGVHAHGNVAGYWGGAFANFGAELTITGSTLEGNTADEGGAAYTGLGPEAWPSTMILEDTEVLDNTAMAEGGAIWAGTGDTVIITDSTLTGNVAGNVGGAVHNLGTLTVEGSTFTSNQATCDGDCSAFGGGAIFTVGSDAPGTTYLARTSFRDNTADQLGGAIFSFHDDVYATNVTFVGNEANEGGAIANRGTAWLARTTLARNVARLSGSGGAIFEQSLTTTHLDNTVVAENTAGGDLRNCAVEGGTIVSDGHNVSDDDTCFTDGQSEGDRAGVDARLAAVDTSGATDVVPLLPSSPAVDIGTDWGTADQCPVATEAHLDEVDNDQRGEPAPVDGDADGSESCDAGAHEFQPNVVTVADTTDGSEAGPTDGTVTLARTGDTSGTLAVAYTVAGTASPGGDYTTLSGSATFPAGATTTVVRVEVLADDEDEDAETVELTLAEGDGYLVGSPDAGTVTIADDAPDATERLAGDDRVDTAVLVSQRSFPDGSDVVVIARSDVYADALAGGPYAHQVDAPILVTPPTQLRGEVVTEIDRLGATQAVILGGPIAISPEVQARLEDELGLATARLEGPDRFATAADIADEIGGDHVYVTEGTNTDASRGWPDAVSVAPVAAHGNHPILFVRSDALPAPTRAQLQEQAPTSATIIGGEVAVSDAVEADVDDVVGNVDRIAGATRYDTSVAVAEAGLAAGLSVETLWVARSDNWVDALVAGPAVARAGDSFVLVPPDDLATAPVVRDWIADHADTIASVVITGGSDAISEVVEQQLDDLVD